MSAENETGSDNVTVRGYMLALTEAEIEMVHYALYLAYGNDDYSIPLWNKLRAATRDNWPGIVERSGRHMPPPVGSDPGGPHD